MRPSILDPLFAPVTTLEGIGNKVAILLGNLLGNSGELNVPRVSALAFHLPHSLIDRRSRPGIAFAGGGIVTLALYIDRHQPTPRGQPRVPYRVFGHDETGEISLTFFRAKGNWLENALPVGERVIVSGRVEWFNGRASMVHPDYMVLESKSHELPLVEPIYGLTAGLSSKVLRKAVTQSVERVPEMPEWIDPTLLAREQFPPFKQALETLHNPDSEADLALDTLPRQRLAYDELLAGQLALALVRKTMKRSAGRKLAGDNTINQRVLEAFHYPLTDAQKRSIDEIKKDMASDERMLRLLQGDVGSGKTIVALCALSTAVEAGTQGALMAPTEVLARQHFATIKPIAERAGLRVDLLTGREKGVVRRDMLAALAAGELDILIGTHAIFQEGVVFKDLGLAVVDEQHRFGVHQRLLLASKGQATDMLVMTATPIPRTLVLTHYGDMDVSRLDEKPVGRKPIKTVALPLGRIEEITTRMGDAIKEGQKIYWICPLVEENEDLGLTSVEQRHKELSSRFGSNVGLVHGQMKGAEKDAAMAAFKSGETRILVATTVIEVGVDVPDATIIVIEHAERFGLSQLHQLRGRVGRGDQDSSCLLLYKDPLGETSRARLEVMRQTEDGFRIAEEDLQLRGEGEVLGTRQSGMAGFRLARMEAHGHLLEIARDDARLIIHNDPKLETQRGQALRTLLYLFERDSAIRLLQAG
ncbi:ATP-dependent DNA helicase RecG [Ahrensia kielensis]|uniref:ATP-dependent DNA helicase RecG n=1 Tax=Ahrensia kielensis TaxID=76980 RepID=UPI000372D58E|nr:ATP-dependent DNA helicase RecG [Ahrensia kielensis]